MNVSVYQAAAALNASNRWQEVIGENLASASIVGYKKQDVSFAAIQAGLLAQQNAPAGSLQRLTLSKAQATTNFQNGELTFSGEKLDVALESKAFFELQLPNGGTTYTRNGSFQMNSQGTLVNKAGYPVMGMKGPIQLDPRNGDPIVISREGEVRQGNDIRGKIHLVEFDRPELLTLTGGAYFLADNPALQQTDATSPNLRQGFLESSNASSVHEMANMITAMRMYEANQKVIQTQDDRMSRAISELGNPTS
ncbi:MAG TPA: flagellar hook-basal body protein [Verrucomicrobiae bacterium]|nr:flagellar hook-basal body protein [Verrucomicrobiae bacterium]